MQSKRTRLPLNDFKWIKNIQGISSVKLSHIVALIAHPKIPVDSVLIYYFGQ